MSLSREEKAALLRLARRSIEHHVCGNIEEPRAPESASLREHCGAFVTLKQNGELRGCIGYPEPVKPLYLAVADAAVAAALHDPRFPPVTPQEVESLRIEISVLGPLTPVKSPDEIVLGKHGLVVRSGASSGLLLPQVAIEHNMDLESFLAHTCRKAGLPPNAWRKGAEIFAFTAEVFSEEDDLQEA